MAYFRSGFLLGQFGEEARGIPVARVEAFESGLKKAGVPHEVHIYPGANHAFANPTGTRFNKEAAAKAGERTTAFLKKHLKAEQREGRGKVESEK